MRYLTLFTVALLSLSLVACKRASATNGADDPEAKLDRPIVSEDITVGEGEPIASAYLVMIEYVGTFPGGDFSFDRNDTKDSKGEATKPPYVVLVGAGTSVKGLEEGLVGMRKGGVRKMTIPWQKAYGAAGRPEANIPAKQDLVFTVKLLDYVRPRGEFEFDYEDVKVGSGREVNEGDRVTIHYRGTYTNGKMFDDSRQRGEAKGGTSFTFRIGGNDAIQGIDFGVRGMKVGGTRIVWVPPMLAFGKDGYMSIQGNQILLFDIELLRID